MKYNALNFSGCPGALPAAVLNETRDAVVAPRELRASRYHAVTLDAVETLCEALVEFGVHHV